MPSNMHGYTQIYVYSYILLGILKFALYKEHLLHVVVRIHRVTPGKL
jgi:hypothetical protein